MITFTILRFYITLGAVSENASELRVSSHPEVHRASEEPA